MNKKSKIPAHAKKVFQGEIFSIYQWEQELYDGSFATFEVASRWWTGLVIPVMKNGNILVAKQEQPWKWVYIDFLGGRQNEWETLLDTAKRELLEEAWVESSDFELLAQKDWGTSKLDWTIEYYVARGCEKIQEQNLDSGEKLEVLEVSLEDFFNLNFEEGIRMWKDFQRVIRTIKNTPELLEKLST